MNYQGNWNYPTAVKFGAGRIDELAATCQGLGIFRPLLVTDQSVASLPMTQRVMEILTGAGLEAKMFSGVVPNPTGANLDEGLATFKVGNHDGVIGFGGGSSLDLAKVIALMADQTISVWDLEDVDDWWTRADANKIYPIIAVPTTAGTGSEVGRAGLLIQEETKSKKIIFHPKMMPSVVICDAELTVGMPKSITAGTGMDAFAHSLEAYCSPHYHPMSQGIALEGMRLVKNNLLNAYKDGDNLEARTHMMSAAMMGATAFQKGLGAIHAISHPVGAIYNTHHGTTNAAVMRQVLTFNRSAIEKRIVRAAAYLDIDGGFDGFCDFVVDLNDALDIPQNLTELGCNPKDIELIAKEALKDPSVGGNPIEMTMENTRKLVADCF